jgi:hypothetical protein
MEDEGGLEGSGGNLDVKRYVGVFTAIRLLFFL